MVVAWTDLEELRGERKICTDYTTQVLEAMFGSEEPAEGFGIAALPYERSSGNVHEFASNEKNGVLHGITFLRSLRKRLPLIANKVGKPSPPSKQVGLIDASQDDPRAQATAELLQKVHPDLADSYRQVLRDLRDVASLSYRGTASELREILRELLERLAPDNEVVSQAWFTGTETSDGKKRRGPTHQQRGRSHEFRTLQRNRWAWSNKDYPELVRDMYSRASVASHTAQDLDEIKRQLRYFEALVHDLCGE